MKTNFTFLLLLFFTMKSFSQNCNDAGFEQNNLINNWNCYIGECVTGPTGGPPTLNNVNQQVLTNPHYYYDASGFSAEYRMRITPYNNNIYDSIIPFLPSVSPWGGNHSLKLGNESPGSRAEKVTKVYYVDSSNAYLTYQYAVVLENPLHNMEEQPAFRYTITDSNGNLINSTSSNITIAGQSNIGLTSYVYNGGFNEINYRPWTIAILDLSAYIGQNIKLEFTVNDCTLGGHFGYAYLDFDCISFNPNDSINDSLSTARIAITAFNNNNTFTSSIIKAPEGYTNYQWKCNHTYNSIAPGNIISNADSLIITLADTASTFYLSMNYLQSPAGVIQPQIEYKVNVVNLITNVKENNIDKKTILNFNNQNNKLTLESTESNINVVITNIGGMNVYDKQFTKGINNINLDELSAGIYIVSVSDKNGIQIIKKIIKQ